MGPRPTALDVWSLSHWTTREVPGGFYFSLFSPLLVEVFARRMNPGITCVNTRPEKGRKEGRREVRARDRAPPGRGDWLTVGGGGPQLTGRLGHVLRQQLPVGDPRGHLPVQLLVQELLHSGACGRQQPKPRGLSRGAQGQSRTGPQGRPAW